jgi:hypothetical protein
MEDDGFVDDGFIEETAWEYVGLHGGACVSVLRRLAEAAERGGDELTLRRTRQLATQRRTPALRDDFNPRPVETILIQERAETRRPKSTL